MNKESLNTIFIISKGRPSCTTAKTLTKIEYPGEWYIVCGNNDETVDEYIKNWGKDRVLIFDWYQQIKESNLLDNFGCKDMGSGAVPVRNATRKIAEAMGKKRHWQFDDDYTGFAIARPRAKAWKKLNGQELESELFKLAMFGDKAGLTNIGFTPSGDARPDTWNVYKKRVFNAHNMPTANHEFMEWKGRMNDDLINSIECKHKGKKILSVKYLKMDMKLTQQEEGGNTDIYKDSGTVRKTAYAVLFEPKAVKLINKFWRYHHRVNWRIISPKLIHDKFSAA